MVSRYPTLFSLLVAGACVAKDAATPAPSVNADSVLVRVERDLPQLRHDTATVFDRSTEGALLTASYEGQQLRRLRAEYMGEMGRSTESFYFDSALVLVMTRELRYDKPFGKVSDSSIARLELAAMPVRRRDSLRAEVDTLLALIKNR